MSTDKWNWHYRIEQIIPADGWRAAFKDEEGSWTTQVVAWGLVEAWCCQHIGQEECEDYDCVGKRFPDHEVVPLALMEGAYVCPIGAQYDAPFDALVPPGEEPGT